MNTDTIFGSAAEDSFFGEDAAASGAERFEPGETQTASLYKPGPILPSPLLHSAAARVEIPEGQTVVHVTVAPGETVTLPFAADAQFLVRLGDGNLAIKVGDVTIILEGYADASGDPEQPVVIQGAEGAPLDIASLLAATDPDIDIQTAAGPGDPGGQGTDNTGAIFQQLGDDGEGGDGTPGGAGAQEGTTGPAGGDAGDAGGDPNPARFPNDLGPVNAAPETSAAAVKGLEDAVSIAVPLSGLDSDGFVALFAITSLPTGGKLFADAALTVLLAINDTVPAAASAATVYFVPDPNFNGTPSFQYTAIDNGGLQDATPATATITVTPVNDAPVSNPDTFAVDEGGTTTVAVLTNDTDAENDPLTVTILTGPAHGTLVVNLDGTITYQHDGSETTGDSFTYKTNDGTVDGNTATVSINVTPVNDAPVSTADSITASEGGIATILAGGATSILTNDTDAESDPLTAILVTGPTNGTLVLNGNGTFSYTHNGSETTTDSFTYKANDGSTNGSTTTVTITVSPVNDAPVAVNDSYTTNEDTALFILSTGGVLENDSDPDSNALHAALVTGPAHGSLTLTPDGNFIYLPNANYSGSDSFTYKANDGTSDSNIATVNITVNAVNDAPTSSDDTYAMNEDQSLTVTFANGLLQNDSDDDGNALTAALVTGPGHGALTLNANGTFTYTPNANFNGSDSFTYKANDGTESGNTATVHVNVVAVNDTPVAIDDSYTTNEDTALFILSTGGVLENDSDPDSDPLHATLVSGPAHGSLTLTPDGNFIYLPNANYNGSDSFTYKANDGTSDSNIATVSITVNAANDAPTSSDDTYAMNEDQSLTVTFANGVLQNDSDDDGNALTVSLMTGPVHGALTLNLNGTFTYTPNAGYHGSDSFTYKANDGTESGNTATVHINVVAANAAPVAVADSITVSEGGIATTLVGGATSILVNDTDGEADPLTAVLVTSPANGTLMLNSNGTFSYTHNGSETTTDSFTYKANDGTADGNTTTVTITVNPVNDVPVLTVPAIQTLAEDSGPNAILGLSVADVDNGSNSMNVRLEVSHGTLSFDSLVGVQAAGGGAAILLAGHLADINAALAGLHYTPNANYNGPDTLSFKALDSGSSSSTDSTVPITVTPVADTPVAFNDSMVVGLDGTATAMADGATSVLQNDTDGDLPADSLTAAVVTGPARGTLTLNPDGTFSYTHDGHGQSDSFTYAVTDAAGHVSNTATVNITVALPPEVRNDQVNVSEGGTATKASSKDFGPGLLDNDVFYGSPKSAVLVDGPQHGTVTLHADGSFSYIHDGSETTNDSFTYKGFDGVQYSPNVATVNISITLLNDNDPVANDDAIAVDAGGTATALVGGAINLQANDTDADTNDYLTGVVLVDGPVHAGAFTLNDNGTFSYTHDGSGSLADSFTYKTMDSAGNFSNTATVDITVSPPNHAPVANFDSIIVAPGGTTAQLDGGSPTVLLNDSDADTDPLTAVLVQAPLYGTLTLNSNGTFSYTHNGSANLYDSFTYKANDGSADSNTATVFISVQQPNIFTPFAVNDSIVLDKGATTAALVGGAASVLANDFDMDPGSTLTAVLAFGAAHGSVTLNPDGTFSYTHSGGADLTDSFAYQVSDGIHLSMPAVVTIAINPPPPVDPGPTTNADNVFTNFGFTPFQIPEWMLLYNDVGKDPTQLDVTGVAGFGFFPPVHTPGTGSAGYITFTGDFMMLGGGTFTYAATEGGVTGNTATVTVQTQTMIPGTISGTGGQDILIDKPGTDSTLNGGGSFGTKGDLIFAGDGDDSIFLHTQAAFLPIPGAPPIDGASDVVYGGTDTVAKDNGLMAGLHGDVLVISELSVDFTDGFKLDSIEGIRVDTSGMPYERSITLSAANVIDMSDHTIKIDDGSVFSSKDAIYINIGAVDDLYLSVTKDGGHWSDTGKFATDGVSKIYVHDTGAGAAGTSENAYVIVAPTTGTVHLNQDG